MFVVERCGEFVEQMRDTPLAPEVVHHAKRAVIDLMAAALPGGTSSSQAFCSDSLKVMSITGKTSSR